MYHSHLNPLQTLVAKVGDSHFYQFRMFLIFSLKWLIAGYFLMSLNFLFLTRDFTCSDVETNHGQLSCQDLVCDSEDPGFWLSHLKGGPPNTLSYKFGTFVCSKQWIVSTVESLAYWGSLLGFILMPFISDNIGRKKAEVFAWVLGTFGLLLLVAAFNIEMVGVGLFIAGFGLNSAMTLHYSFIKAFVNGPWRDRMIVSFQIAFSFGVCGIAATAIFIESWRILSAIMLTVCFLLCLCSNMYEETPELLFNIKDKDSEDRHGALLACLNRIADTNNKPHVTDKDIPQDIIIPSKSLKNPLSFVSLFKYRSLRLISYCCGFINMTIQFVYDATIFSLDRVGLNLNTNQIVVGLAEATSAVYSALVVTRFRRRPYLMVCLLIVGACLTVFIITGFNAQNIQFKGIAPYIELGVLILMRFVLSSVWGYFFVFIGQLYPTEVMSLAYGYVSAVGTLAASVSPYIKLLAKDNSLVVMACLCVAACAHVYPLRQTYQQVSKTTIEERQTEEREPFVESIITTA